MIVSLNWLKRLKMKNDNSDSDLEIVSERLLKILKHHEFNLAKKDEDYYFRCLNCGRTVLVGKCCDNFLSQAILDKK